MASKFQESKHDQKGIKMLYIELCPIYLHAHPTFPALSPYLLALHNIRGDLAPWMDLTCTPLDVFSASLSELIPASSHQTLFPVPPTFCWLCSNSLRFTKNSQLLGGGGRVGAVALSRIKCAWTANCPRAWWMKPADAPAGKAPGAAGMMSNPGTHRERRE